MPVKLPLANRAVAGQALADALESRFAGRDVLVLALPRGGVPVAREIAARLDAELDVLIVRKLGTPGQRELALGAIASGGIRVLNEALVQDLGITAKEIDAIAASEGREIERREALYRGKRARPEIANRIVLLVDDGVATGATMRAAIAALRQRGPASIVVAVPVAAADTLRVLETEADEVVCLATPTPFWAVGQWYVRFDQVSDGEVRDLLAAHAGAGRAEGGKA
jgi:putative phosphoribosyl transferase